MAGHQLFAPAQKNVRGEKFEIQYLTLMGCKYEEIMKGRTGSNGHEDPKTTNMERVKDAEHWAQLKEISEKKLLVVDAHKDWCGPCKIMEPTYKRLIAEIERSEQRVVFASVNLSHGMDGVEDNGSCKPRFLLFKDRKVVGEVNGANAPQLEHLIQQHLPSLASLDDDP